MPGHTTDLSPIKSEHEARDLAAKPEDLPKIFGIFTRWFGK